MLPSGVLHLILNTKNWYGTFRYHLGSFLWIIYLFIVASAVCLCFSCHVGHVFLYVNCTGACNHYALHMGDGVCLRPVWLCCCMRVGLNFSDVPITGQQCSENKLGTSIKDTQVVCIKISKIHSYSIIYIYKSTSQICSATLKCKKITVVTSVMPLWMASCPGHPRFPLSEIMWVLRIVF